MARMATAKRRLGGDVKGKVVGVVNHVRTRREGRGICKVAAHEHIEGLSTVRRSYSSHLPTAENALRHTPPGTRIRVWTATAHGEATLVVQDDGPGVPPELAPKLFERFVRGAGDRGGSFGLGLAIVHAVAVSHGGTVTLEPTGQSNGARFVVRLPGASDLHDDGQHHRPPLQTVVD